jgi:release factor glutamine methyltransferase
MLTYNKAFHTLTLALQATYDKQEVTAIAQRYMEHLTGLTYTQRLVRRDEHMEESVLNQLEQDKALLVAGKPLQQVLGYEWFLSRRFNVNEHVLIPRPETEELVMWVCEDSKNRKELSILDIGSGSGCIPVSLKLEMPQATIVSCDVSNDALIVALENAATLQADVSFMQLDFLNGTERSSLPLYDIIVSNPPYIPETEAVNMHMNVKEYEPHLALFVPGNDPLLFYREIAVFGKEHLQEHGTIYCELHVDHALQTAALFDSMGYKSEVKEDMHGNLRMLKAIKA